MKNTSKSKFGRKNNNSSEPKELKRFSNSNKSLHKNTNKQKNARFSESNSKDYFKDKFYKTKNDKPRTYSKDNGANRFNNKYEIKQKNLDDFIWGKHSVFSALEAGKPINRIWCTTDIRSSEKFFLMLKEAKNKGTLIEEVPWSRISQITQGAVHQGIALQISYSSTVSIDELINLSRKKTSSPVIICLDGITDPHNVGAIIRSAEAFGCTGIVIPQRRSAGITGTVAKVAAGALEHIAITRVINLNRTLQEFKNNGFTVIGLTEKASINISDFKESEPFVVVVGSENKGLSLITQRYCDYLLRIPLRGKTTSLNASVAAALSISHLTTNNHKNKSIINY